MVTIPHIRGKISQRLAAQEKLTGMDPGFSAISGKGFYSPPMYDSP
jgi:hypothetical protein